MLGIYHIYVYFKYIQFETNQYEFALIPLSPFLPTLRTSLLSSLLLSSPESSAGLAALAAAAAKIRDLLSSPLQS